MTKRIVPFLNLLILISTLFSQNSVPSYLPLSVGAYWSRKAINDGKKSHYYYRPQRFDYLKMETSGSQTIQIRAFVTQKFSSLDIYLNIADSEKKYTLNFSHHEKNIYYTEPINITIPSDIDYFSLKTRHPHAYFRHYKVQQEQKQQKVFTLKPNIYRQSLLLQSTNSHSEYFSADQEYFLQYLTLYEGDIHFYLRSIMGIKEETTVGVYVNDKLRQTIVIPSKISAEYQLPNNQVSIGCRVDLPLLQPDDVIKLIPQSSNEIICRMFLTTKDFY